LRERGREERGREKKRRRESERRGREERRCEREKGEGRRMRETLKFFQIPHLLPIRDHSKRGTRKFSNVYPIEDHPKREILKSPTPR
jgi:hypothetical protein